MKKIIISIVLSLVAMVAIAQAPRVKLSSEYSGDNVLIKATCKGLGSNTVIIRFSELDNVRFPTKVHMATVYSSGTILRLEPVDPKRQIKYHYSYRVYRGILDPRNVDDKFVYRLPYSTSENRKVEFLYDFYDRHWGKSLAVKMKAFSFEMNRGDTIQAARKGIVITVEDGHDPLVGVGNASMRTEQNELYIEHMDGTVARYSALARGSFMVKEGDTVYPGTPLALAGSYDGETYQVRFDVQYMISNKDDSANVDFQVKYMYLDPVFATSEGHTKLTEGNSYTPSASDEMITAEMTKREIKTLKQQ